MSLSWHFLSVAQVNTLPARRRQSRISTTGEGRHVAQGYTLLVTRGSSSIPLLLASVEEVTCVPSRIRRLGRSLETLKCL
ncbi:unnamed protein product [Arctogadus glacialis]